jgi:hypothetical protein
MSINYTVLATGALGLTVALAWNTAANKVITALFPNSGGAAASVAYAVVVTIFVICLVRAINHVGTLFGGGGDTLPWYAPPGPVTEALHAAPVVNLRWPARRGRG